MQYPADLRDVVVRRILAHEISAKEAVDEYGVAHSTVYHWVSRARKRRRRAFVCVPRSENAPHCCEAICLGFLKILGNLS